MASPSQPLPVSLAAAPLTTIIAHIRDSLARGQRTIDLVVADPALGVGHHAGETVITPGGPVIHRPFRTWVDLAERMNLRLTTPRLRTDGLLHLTLQALDASSTWEASAPPEASEKYGVRSGYQRITKREDPSMVLDLADALQRCALPPRPRVLDLGVNTGDELELMLELCPELAAATFVGIDHCASALAEARARLDDPRHRFIEADLGALPGLALDPFDLVVSIGTLHSPGIDDRELLRHVVQRRLTPGGCLILGIPNCRYLDGEVLYGARMKNFHQPELSLMIKNVAFYRRYLQQHRRRVFVTGKHYVLVTAVPLRS